jgi:phage shock protein C
MNYTEELEKLSDLHTRGILTDDEFARAKARVLNGQGTTYHRTAIGNSLDSLRRSRSDRWIGGVCGGLGHFTDIPVWLWRMGFVIFVLCGGAGIVAYLLMWLFVPIEQPEGYRPQQGY